jgi:hypothetical protein
VTSRRLIAAKGVIPLTFDGGLVLVDEVHHRVAAYNETAALIWNWRAEGRPIPEMTATLRDEAGLSAADASSHVRAILDHWRLNGFTPASPRKEAAAPKTSISASRRKKPQPAKWSAQWTCAIRGRTYRFAVEPARLVPPVRILLSHLEVSKAAPDHLFEIRRTGPNEAALIVDGEEQMRGAIPHGFKDAVHRALVERVYPDLDWFAVLHAGAFARDGKCIVLPAESGSGKTTLIGYLMAHGYEYYADDMVVLANGTRVLPWPMPLSVKSGAWELLAKLHPKLTGGFQFPTKGGGARLLVPPPDSWEKPPIPLSFLVFPTFDANRRTTLQRLRPLDVLERLLRGRAWLGHPLRAEHVRSFLDRLRAIPSFSLVFSSIESASRQLKKLA